MNTTYHGKKEYFELEYNDSPDTRVCFFINKRLDPKSWTVTHHSPDAATVHLKVWRDEKESIINIHNFYNEPTPEGSGDFYVITQKLGETMDNIEKALRLEGEHILTGDFNLHHQAWAGHGETRHHNTAKILMELVNGAEMALTLPVGTITRERGEHRASTLDLIFISQSLLQNGELQICGRDKKLDHHSDHYPIHTILDLEVKQATPRKIRAWKKTDQETFIWVLQHHLQLTKTLLTKQEIDESMYNVVHAIQEAIDASTPWADINPQSKSYWTNECTEVVMETRRAKRRWKRYHTAETEEAFRNARARKKKVLRKHKMEEHRARVTEAAATDHGIWRIAKWAKMRNDKTKTSRKIPTLVEGDFFAESTADKLRILGDSFFPTPPPPDMSDTLNFQYPDRIHNPGIHVTEVAAALDKTPPRKAPGLDQIPNHILHRAKTWILHHLTLLLEASLRLGYYPEHCRQSNTIVLRKPGKDNYTIAKAYRPIALLNTVGKVMESVVAKRLSYMAETEGLLPDTHMGGRKKCSVDTAVQLLVEKTKAVWGKKGHWTASILSLDVAGAFDNVSHERLLHNLRKRRIPEDLVTWIKSFLANRTTFIQIENEQSLPIQRDTGIPQGSPLSPILYLFYNADLLEICENTALRTSGLGYADDVNIFVYGQTTEENCDTLNIIHDQCQVWASRHCSKFAPAKYELLHLSKKPTRHNLGAVLTLGNTVVQPKPVIRILGFHLDSRLNWKTHLAIVSTKAKACIGALRGITASTWGSTLQKARTIYIAMVRPILLFGCTAWMQANAKGELPKAYNKVLQSVQGQALRVVCGAFKNTSLEALDVETHTIPILIKAKQTLQANLLRLCSSGKLSIIEKAVKAIADQKRTRRNTLTTLTSRTAEGMLNMLWLQTSIGNKDLKKIERIDAFPTPPWWRPPDTTIDDNPEEALKRHNDLQKNTNRSSIYTDGSGYNGGVGAAAVFSQAEYRLYLGTAEEATVYAAELVGVMAAFDIIRFLIARNHDQGREGYDIYTDNQAAIKAVQTGYTRSGQETLREIAKMWEQIRESTTANITIIWTPAHLGTPGNEHADQAAKKAAEGDVQTSQSLKYTPKSLIAAIKTQSARRWQEEWEQDWKTSPKGRHSYRITERPNKNVLKLHGMLSKAKSAIGVQLRTGKIGLGEFLHGRKVPGFDTPLCSCGEGDQSVHHVLLACSRWTQERWEAFGRTRHRDLAKLLGEPDTLRAAINMILETGLLGQFSRVREALRSVV